MGGVWQRYLLERFAFVTREARRCLRQALRAAFATGDTPPGTQIS